MRSITLASFFLLAFLLLGAFVPERAAALEDDPDDAAFTFTLAKLLADEGSYRQALEAFEKAVSLEPEEPYLRTEYAEYLVRLAELTRLPGYRQRHLARAVQQADAARRLAPKNPEILRVVGETYLTMAELDPQDPTTLSTALDIFEQLRQTSPDEIPGRLALAQIHLLRNRPDLAADIYREVALLSPGDRRVRRMLVDALMRSGRSSEAEEVLQEMLAIDPRDDETRLQLAELQARRGDAFTAVETVRQGTPPLLENPEVRRFLATQLLQSGRLEEALAETQSLLAAGADADLLRLHAVVLGAAGRHQEAVDRLRQALAEYPEDPDLALTLARILPEVGGLDESLKIFEELNQRLEGAPGAEMVRLEWLRQLLAAERWAEAETVIQPMVGEGSAQERLGIVLTYADVLYQLGRGDEALAKLAQEQPEDLRNLAKRAEILLRLERVEEGAEVLGKLAASGDERAVLSAASVYQSLERYADSIRVLRPFVERHPDSVDALFLLGAAYERSGEFPRAEVTFRQLLGVDPDYHQAMNYLGYMWAERGENLEEALGLIEKAVASEPDNGAYVDSLGWVYHRLGRHEQALRELEKAVLLEPGDATVLEHLGDVYRSLGREQEAQQVYREALALDAENAGQLRQKLEPVAEEQGTSSKAPLAPRSPNDSSQN